MLDLGYELRDVQKRALQFAADQTEDAVPAFDAAGVDFTEVGFRALPQIRYKEQFGGRPLLAHFEAGNWMSKMAVRPEADYNAVLERTMDLKTAEDKSGKGRFIVVDDFVINELIRFYAQFKGKIKVDDAVWARVKEMLLESEFAPYHEPMSENHKICYLSSELIAAELFPDDVFFDGETGAQRLHRVKRSIKMFLEKRFRRGWSEFDSGSYYEIDLVSLLNIFDFSKDEELRQMASDSINSMLAAMFHHSVGGYPAGPKGRVYFNVAEDAKKGMYYYVKTAGDTEGDTVFDEPLATGVVYFALSSFQLDNVVYQLAFGPKETGYEVLESNALYTIPDDMNLHGRFKKYFYVGRDYALGSIVERDDPFENDAYTWLCGHQEQAWSMTFGKNSRATIFSSHPGNEALHDFGMHGYWTGDSLCLCAKFAQDKNAMLAYYDIRDREQLQFIHLYLPEQEFDEVLYGERCIVARSGDVCAKLVFSGQYFACVTGQYAGKEIILPYPRCGFLLEVFEGITAAEAEKLPGKIGVGPDGICAAASDGRELSILNGKTYLSGKEMEFDSYPLYHSPYVESEYDSGRVVVRHSGKEKVYGIQ